MTHIWAAAILYHGTIYTLPVPARHPNILWSIPEYDHSGKQGFITDEIRFVNRQEAWNVAKAADQIKRVTGNEGTLFSEDMW